MSNNAIQCTASRKARKAYARNPFRAISNQMKSSGDSEIAPKQKTRAIRPMQSERISLQTELQQCSHLLYPASRELEERALANQIG